MLVENEALKSSTLVTKADSGLNPGIHLAVDSYLT